MWVVVMCVVMWCEYSAMYEDMDDRMRDAVFEMCVCACVVMYVVIRCMRIWRAVCVTLCRRCVRVSVVIYVVMDMEGHMRDTLHEVRVCVCVCSNLCYDVMYEDMEGRIRDTLYQMGNVCSNEYGTDLCV